MATVTGLTKERMLEIEGNSVVDGFVNANKHLILTRHDGTEIDAGNVEGPQGISGMEPTGTIPDGADLNTYLTPGVYEAYSYTMARTGLNFPGIGTTETEKDNTRWQGRLIVSKDSNGVVYQEWIDVLDQRWSRSYSTTLATWMSTWSRVPRFTTSVGDGSPIYPVSSDAQQAFVVAERTPTQQNPLFISRTDARIGEPNLRATQDGLLWWDIERSRQAVPYIPLPWNAAAGWTNYLLSYHPAGYFKGSRNIVSLTGLIASGTATGGTIIGTLPPGYRPDTKLIFQTLSSTGMARIDINPDGNIVAGAGVSSGWTSLDGIHFLAADPERVWTTLTLINSFSSYHLIDASWPAAAYHVDPLGRVWFRGLVRRAAGAPAADTAMFTMPISHRPSLHLHMWGMFDTGYGSMDFTTTGDVRWKTNGTLGVGYISLSNLSYAIESLVPLAFWTDIPYTAPWTRYSNLFPTQAYAMFDDGFVMLKGLITGGTEGSSSGTFNSGATADYRAGAQLYACSAAATISRVDLAQTLVHRAPHTTVWKSLNGVNFVAGA